MTGPKVNAFCSSYDFKAHTFHNVICKEFNNGIFSFPRQGFFDLCEQCPNWRTERLAGVQTSIRVGEMELPGELSAVVYAQWPAKR